MIIQGLTLAYPRQPYLKKSLTIHIQHLANKYAVVTLLGPRQSGKTTLVKAACPKKPYANMEDSKNRARLNGPLF